MKKLIITFVLSSLTFLSIGAQEISVEDHTMTLDAVKRTGLKTDIALGYDFVKGRWKTFLKQYGSVSSSKGNYVLEEATISGINNGQLVKIYTSLNVVGENVRVFWSIDFGDEYLSSGSPGYQKAKNLLYQFALETYRADVQIQIEDAEKALQRTVKEQEKTLSEGDNLQNDLDKNSERQVKLEEAIQLNEENKETLDSLVQVNLLNQKAKELEVQQMQEALEIVKQKLNELK